MADVIVAIPAAGDKEKEKESPDEGLDENLVNGVSLQDSFRKFMDQKKKERQILKLSRNGEFNGNGGRTEAYKDSLRQKFIEAAKCYIGVPYAERYKEEDVPVAPLYLDCCALVRRAVTDLQEDFGIILGKWNQAYQMDTLPIVLQQSELRPGDLIFYEGLFISKRSKSQKHNNVHVEIFLGGETGEATIGSRYHKGKVSIFPSFKFTSTTWSLVQYHFRSLDTWLNGECKSHCPEHLWHSDMLGIEAAAGKRSIFNTDSDDESAGGNEDEDRSDEIQNDEDNVGNQSTDKDLTAKLGTGIQLEALVPECPEINTGLNSTIITARSDETNLSTLMIEKNPCRKDSSKKSLVRSKSPHFLRERPRSAETEVSLLLAEGIVYYFGVLVI
jgi:hypothetical protein